MRMCDRGVQMLITTVGAFAAFSLMTIAVGTDYWLYSRGVCRTKSTSDNDTSRKNEEVMTHSGLWRTCCLEGTDRLVGQPRRPHPGPAGGPAKSSGESRGILGPPTPQPGPRRAPAPAAGERSIPPGRAPAAAPAPREQSRRWRRYRRGRGETWRVAPAGRTLRGAGGAGKRALGSPRALARLCSPGSAVRVCRRQFRLGGHRSLSRPQGLFPCELLSEQNPSSSPRLPGSAGTVSLSGGNLCHLAFL